MRQNRSMPRCTVIPELAYADGGEAMARLRDAFGFTLRLQIADVDPTDWGGTPGTL